MLYLPFSLTLEISWSSNSRDWKLYQRANWIKSHRLFRNLYNVCVLPFSSATLQIDKQFSPNKKNSSGLVKKLKDHTGRQYTAVKRKEFWDYQMWLFSTSSFCWNKFYNSGGRRKCWEAPSTTLNAFSLSGILPLYVSSNFPLLILNTPW